MTGLTHILADSGLMLALGKDNKTNKCQMHKYTNTQIQTTSKQIQNGGMAGLTHFLADNGLLLALGKDNKTNKYQIHKYTSTNYIKTNTKWRLDWSDPYPGRQRAVACPWEGQ